MAKGSFFAEPGGHSEVSPLGPDNIALRGTKLQNTEYVFGCAVYTGSDTKMSQNSQLKANKFSSIEVAMNKYFVAYILILLFEMRDASFLLLKILS